MRRSSSFLLILIVFAFLAKTGVTTFAPGFAKFPTTSTAVPSDWNEETAEEDESGEEDKALNDMPSWQSVVMISSAPSTDIVCTLRGRSTEIVVPPPQG